MKKLLRDGEIEPIENCLRDDALCRAYDQKIAAALRGEDVDWRGWWLKPAVRALRGYR